MREGFERMNQRFEQADKRHDAMLKRHDVQFLFIGAEGLELLQGVLHGGA